MSPWRLRSRLLDIAVALICVGCISAPMVPIVAAADSQRSIIESGGSIDQRVLQSGVISNPLNTTMQGGRKGVVNGSIQWDISTSANDGMKLVMSSDRDPAMRDAGNGIDVGDYPAASPEEWNIGADDRRFGFSGVGDLMLGRFGDGKKWRGFDGKRGIELGRRSNPIPRMRSTVKLRAEFAQTLPSGARTVASVRATAVVNL